MSCRSVVVAVAATLSLSAGARAQTAADATGPATGADPASSPDPLDAIKDRLIHADFPTLLTSIIDQSPSDHSNILNLRYIKPDNSQEKSGWAVDYKWSKSLDKSRVGPNQHNEYIVDKLAYAFNVDGSYAFSGAKNDQNLSTANASVRMERGSLGQVTFNDPALSKAYLQCLKLVPAPTADAAQRAQNDRQLYKCIQAGGIDKLVGTEPGKYYYSLDFHGGVEANQNYSDTHTLFGFTAIFASEPSRSMSVVNVLDWPFRLLRNGFGDDGGYVAPFPTVKAKVERVDAGSDTARKALTSKTTYTRAEGEAAFGTVLANFGGNLLRLTAAYRYFHELSAPAPVQQAGQDNFHYFAASLRFPAKLFTFIHTNDYELFVSYTSGKLPFDQTSGKAVGVGFQTNIKVLSDLLAP